MKRRECRGWGTSAVCSQRGREDRDPPPNPLSRLSLTEYWISGNNYSLTSFSEKAMAPHSSSLAWKIPWTDESGWLKSLESLRVRHD